MGRGTRSCSPASTRCGARSRWRRATAGAARLSSPSASAPRKRRASRLHQCHFRGGRCVRSRQSRRRAAHAAGPPPLPCRRGARRRSRRRAAQQKFYRRYGPGLSHRGGANASAAGRRGTDRRDRRRPAFLPPQRRGFSHSRAQFRLARSRAEEAGALLLVAAESPSRCGRPGPSMCAPRNGPTPPPCWPSFPPIEPAAVPFVAAMPAKYYAVAASPGAANGRACWRAHDERA